MTFIELLLNKVQESHFPSIIYISVTWYTCIMHDYIIIYNAQTHTYTSTIVNDYSNPSLHLHGRGLINT